MMFCFTLHGIKFCFRIPVLLVRWPPWPPPNGDPWKRIGDWVQGPTPNPWKENVVILATINQLAQHAKGGLKRELQGMVRSQVAEIQKQLPEGATLELQKG